MVTIGKNKKKNKGGLSVFWALEFLFLYYYFPFNPKSPISCLSLSLSLALKSCFSNLRFSNHSDHLLVSSRDKVLVFSLLMGLIRFWLIWGCVLCEILRILLNQEDILLGSVLQRVVRIASLWSAWCLSPLKRLRKSSILFPLFHNSFARPKYSDECEAAINE